MKRLLSLKQVSEELLAGLGLLLATFFSGALLAIWKLGLGDRLAFLAGLVLTFLFYAAHLYLHEKRRAQTRALCEVSSK